MIPLSPPATTLRPLVVDLDGTLIRTDLLHESASRFLLQRPLAAPRLLAWLAAGKSVLKTRLAQSVALDAAVLPYDTELLAWLRAQKEQGRELVLATASHRLLAEQVAQHLGLFDTVLATEDGSNLRAHAKRDVLVARYGERGFDYVGNDWPDLPIFQSAAAAHVVSRSPRLVERVRALGNLASSRVPATGSPAAGLLKAARPHQWAKNLLVFVPLLAAHRYGDTLAVAQALAAFVVLSLAASAVYLLNDLVDVADDRHHERKRLRPFAAGTLSLLHGWLAWPLLLALAFALAAWLLPGRFAAALGCYGVLTAAYSFHLKRVAVVDVLTLAALYTLRIIAGAAAIAVPMSFWLLSFSMFIFLSLALIKRYSELRAARDAGREAALRGRGYSPQDLEMVSSLGAASGYMAVLVLALYIQDSHTAALYGEPRAIWLACPLLLYWISRAWLLTHRGQMHQDPVLFALRDRASWVVAALFVVVFALAKLMP
ncbi:UbiA family prenyltransferase [Ramlibacter sp.]|uniref:UbiA family prenyltransferase n=1 Tax=Ramlibacter sp. TaxID=1917967 RepID=UPI0025D6B7D3|nr:UbiA family prenyltransferase [Ramlibacter sp.]